MRQLALDHEGLKCVGPLKYGEHEHGAAEGAGAGRPDLDGGGEVHAAGNVLGACAQGDCAYRWDVVCFVSNPGAHLAQQSIPAYQYACAGAHLLPAFSANLRYCGPLSVVETRCFAGSAWNCTTRRGSE